MLRQLAIRNVVLVESLDLEFESGLGVLTGETGAGKTILLDEPEVIAFANRHKLVVVAIDGKAA